MSASSYTSAAPVPTHCRFGFPVAHKQSWTSRNPGRRFVTCKFSNPSSGVRGCELFLWVDDNQLEWQRLVINEVLLDKKLLERQVEHLKMQVCNSEEQKRNLLKEIERIRAKYHKVVAAVDTKNRSPFTVKGSFFLGFFVAVLMMIGALMLLTK